MFPFTVLLFSQFPIKPVFLFYCLITSASLSHLTRAPLLLSYCQCLPFTAYLCLISVSFSVSHCLSRVSDPVPQVRGSQPLNTKAVQVECRAKSLNSNDCFVLRVPGGAWVWTGRGASTEERDMARSVARQLCSEPRDIAEGAEPDEFWTALGGKGEYANAPRLAEETAQPARLFHCSNASGAFRVREVADFDQSDLCEDDVMLLDAWDAVFVWVGSKSNREERAAAERAAIEYLRTDPSGRGTGTPVLRVRQHGEPPSFTGFFGAWSDALWAEQPSWAAVQRELQQQNRPQVEQVTERPDLPRYPLGVLRARQLEDLPDDVDPTRKEEYLSAEDFSSAFGVSWERFQAMPQWKRVQKKKEVGLF